ncbi:hypothetical protein QQF64_016383 [Cirrhinus molitorella]|uniref:Uncharacterized protein n=1 Tax=Cirrhinus molitorella TaxID=172907 RepID=A0ABR3LQY4_9TELE
MSNKSQLLAPPPRTARATEARRAEARPRARGNGRKRQTISNHRWRIDSALGASGRATALIMTPGAARHKNNVITAQPRTERLSHTIDDAKLSQTQRPVCGEEHFCMSDTSTG